MLKYVTRGEIMDELLTLLQSQNHLINLIRCNPQISKTELSNKLKLSWPTISTNVSALKENHILSSEDGIQINPDSLHMVGVSIGTAQIKLCIIGMDFKPIDNAKFLKLVNNLDLFKEGRKFMVEQHKQLTNYVYFKTPDNLFELQRLLDFIIEDVCKIVNNQHDYNLNIISFGITFTGAVDNVHQRIIKSHNLEILSGKTLSNILSPNRIDYLEQKNINIYMDNNSTSAVVAEKYNLYSPGNSNSKYKDKKNIMSIYLGAGIGAGLILNNKLYRGATNFAGEIGHIKVPKYPSLKENFKESSCSCGSTDCLDFRIRNDVFEMTKAEFSNMDSAQIDNYCAEHSDKLDIFAHYLGYAVNSLNNILNLDMIIFTGKFKIVIDRLWLLLNQQVNENPLFYIANECQLASSTLGATSPAIGVAICAYFDKVKSDIEW